MLFGLCLSPLDLSSSTSAYSIKLTYYFLVNKWKQRDYSPVFMCLGLMAPVLIKQIPQWKTAVLVGIIGTLVFN